MSENLFSGKVASTSSNSDAILFHEQLNYVLEQNSNDPGFGVEQLTEILAINKSKLNRITVELTGLSPGKLIAHFRMNKAVQLLRENNASVKEVAYQSGFKRHAGFCRSFNQEFRCSPSRFRSLYIDKQTSVTFSWELPIEEEDLVQLLSLAHQQKWLALFLNAVLSDLGNKTLSVNQLSAILNLSSSSLNRRMKEVVGISPQRFIRNLRLQYAAELLALNLETVSQVAHIAGFFDHAHLCRCFKSAFNCQPSAYVNTGIRYLSVKWLIDNLPAQIGK
jgi:AraC-like DNA-binding protein